MMISFQPTNTPGIYQCVVDYKADGSFKGGELRSSNLVLSFRGNYPCCNNNKNEHLTLFYNNTVPKQIRDMKRYFRE